jgi:hypothetical protein
MNYCGCTIYALFSAFLWTFNDEMSYLIASLGRWLVSIS